MVVIDYGLYLSSTELVDLVSGLEALLYRIQLSNITRLPGKTKPAPCDEHICLTFDLALALAVLSTPVQLIPSNQPGQDLASQQILSWIHRNTFSLPISGASGAHGSGVLLVPGTLSSSRNAPPHQEPCPSGSLF